MASQSEVTFSTTTDDYKIRKIGTYPYREERAAYVPFMYMGASAMVEERSRTTSPKNDNNESERENEDHEDERENGGEGKLEGSDGRSDGDVGKRRQEQEKREKRKSREQRTENRMRVVTINDSLLSPHNCQRRHANTLHH